MKTNTPVMINKQKFIMMIEYENIFTVRKFSV